MSCCVSKLDICKLVQESYKSPTFNFGDTDVTNDTFVYKVKIAGASFTEYPCTVIAPNIVVIDEYTLPAGNYIHEMLWTNENGTELIFQGGLKITSVGSCCGSNRNNTIKVIQNEAVVRINYSERIIERITDKGPQGDSAYQVAVDNGFVGTEAEWLESLKGEQGEQGVQGEQGEKGDKGDKGEQGEQGIQGNDGFNGWTPIHVFEADGAQRQVKKLTDYIGGTGTKPTANIGQYVIDGGYTTVKANATNFKGAQNDNLIVEYVHSGNIEVYINSYDPLTGVFTTAQPHGLISSNNIGFVLNAESRINLSTVILGGVNFGVKYRPVNMTSNSFQLSTAVGGAAVLFTVTATTDMTKFHIETIPDRIAFTNLNISKDFKVVIEGSAISSVYYYTTINANYGFIQGNGTASNTVWGTNQLAFFTSPMFISIQSFFVFTPNYISENTSYIMNGNDGSVNRGSRTNKFINSGVVTRFVMEQMFLTNGSVVRLYKL